MATTSELQLVGRLCRQSAAQLRRMLLDGPVNVATLASAAERMELVRRILGAGCFEWEWDLTNYPDSWNADPDDPTAPHSEWTDGDDDDDADPNHGEEWKQA